MKRLQLITVTALLIIAASVGATNLYPNWAKAGAVSFDPDTISGGDQLKKLVDACDATPNPLSLIWWNDYWWWEYANNGHKIRPYMLIRFSKPGGFNGGIMNWRAKDDSTYDVYIYRWKFNGSYFEEKGHLECQYDPEMGEFGVGSDSDWWDEEGYMYILIKGYGVSPSWWGLDCDICVTYYQ
jgi:hypothetical protein